MSRIHPAAVTLGLTVLALCAGTPARAQTPTPAPTFSKDVAPILQRS